MEIGKSVLAVLVGLVAGFITIVIIEQIGHAIYPPDTSLNLKDPVALQTYMNNAPVMSLILVAIAHGIGVFVCGFVASKVFTEKWVVITPMALLGLMTIANLFMIPHPWWFSITDVSITGLGGLMLWKLREVA